MLLAAGLPLPRTVLAHAHWTVGKAKMSKSRGNVADPFEAIRLYGVDSIRFYLMRHGGGLADDTGELSNRFISLLGRLSI
jgi:methionyl-tRNA synthetase